MTFEEGKIYTLQEIVDIAREQQRYIDVLEKEVSLQATQLEDIDMALRFWRRESEYSVPYISPYGAEAGINNYTGDEGE